MDNVPSITNRVSPLHLFAQLLGVSVALSLLLWRSDGAVGAGHTISAAPPGSNVLLLTGTPTPPLCLTVNDSLGINDPVQTGMIAQVGTPSECVWTPRPCPGPVDSQPRHYKVYTYYFAVQSFSTTCITVDLNPTGCPGNLYSVAYTWGSFDPNNICLSYAGDPGVVAAGSSQYTFQVFRGQYFHIVVHEVTPGTGCSQYTLNVSSSRGCQYIFTQTPTPELSRTPTRTPTITSTPSSTPTPQCPPAWHLVPSIQYTWQSRLLGVEALAHDDVWAVGEASRAIHDHWTGSQWVTPSSTPYVPYASRLNDVSALSAQEMWAVGEYRGSFQGTLTERWDGLRWNLVASPNGPGYYNELLGVSARAPDDVWAVGVSITSTPTTRDTTLIEHWDGSAWSVVQSPNVEDNGRLRSVATLDTDDVWAVGEYRSAGMTRTLTLRWDGSRWSVVPSPNTQARSALNDVYAIAPDDIWAVGSSADTTGRVYTLAMHWDGSQWSVIDTPVTADFARVLTSVDASGPNDVWAVGWVNTGGIVRTLTMHWDGSQWQEIPSPNIGNISQLLSISTLPNGEVWAVGLTGPYNTMRSLTMRYGLDSCYTPTPTPSLTSTPSPSASITPVVTDTPTPIPPSITRTASPLPSGSATPTPPAPITETPAPLSPTPTICTLTFSDVPLDHTFYPYVRCLACRGIISGYADGTFRPNSNITRGQTAKVVSNAAGFSELFAGQTYEDVPPSQTFYQWIERLSGRGIMGGYPCGLRESEPCLPENRPYFRPGESTTRGQISKLVSNAANLQDPVSGQFYADVPEDNPFYLWIVRLTNRGVMSGYPCGGVNPQTGESEPCDTENRPYFRWGNNVTRGQSSKIVANTFYPDCFTP